MTTSGPATDREGAGPLGREEVVPAVLTHAADLFAERGPEATSIRAIAERAGVNHGLVFRHFGAKDKLVAAVLDHLATEASRLTDEEWASPEDDRLRRHWTVLARCILDGYPVGQMQSHFPVISRMIEMARTYHPSERGAALAVANVAAFELGWQLFEPFLRSATGLGDTPESWLRQEIDAEAGRILRGARGSADAPEDEE